MDESTPMLTAFAGVTLIGISSIMRYQNSEDVELPILIGEIGYSLAFFGLVLAILFVGTKKR